MIGAAEIQVDKVAVTMNTAGSCIVETTPSSVRKMMGWGMSPGNEVCECLGENPGMLLPLKFVAAIVVVGGGVAGAVVGFAVGVTLSVPLAIVKGPSDVLTRRVANSQQAAESINRLDDYVRSIDRLIKQPSLRLGYQIILVRSMTNVIEKARYACIKCPPPKSRSSRTIVSNLNASVGELGVNDGKSAVFRRLQYFLDYIMDPKNYGKAMHEAFVVKIKEMNLHVPQSEQPPSPAPCGNAPSLERANQK
jgi:hypothetical protein